MCHEMKFCPLNFAKKCVFSSPKTNASNIFWSSKKFIFLLSDGFFSRLTLKKKQLTDLLRCTFRQRRKIVMFLAWFFGKKWCFYSVTFLEKCYVLTEYSKWECSPPLLGGGHAHLLYPGNVIFWRKIVQESLITNCTRRYGKGLRGGSTGGVPWGEGVGGVPWYIIKKISKIHFLCIFP